MSAPSTERTPLGETIGLIAAEGEVWVRVAAIRRDDGKWHARLVELTSGAPPPSWSPLTWDYPWALLTARVESGRAVREWLLASSINLGDREIVLPKANDSLLWERRQSRSPGGYEKLEWPVVETTLALIDNQAEPQGPLVAATDAPSFINLSTAAAYFFYLERQPTGGSLHQGVMYRHQDTSGRLKSVRIAESEIMVEVEGKATRGMVVELAGDTPGDVCRLEGSDGGSAETVSFAVPSGLPAGAWVLLRRGAEWIDRRFLTAPWTRSLEAGVEFVVEPRTRLEAFLADRESDVVEFKRQVPTDEGGKAKVMKTVCAFANGEGGSILFGIDDDQAVIGVTADVVDRLKDQLTQTVGSWVEPRPRIDFATMPLDEGRVVLELRVEPGSSLHGCHARLGDVPAAYIRHHAITVRARPSEIEDIVRARTPSTGPSRAWGFLA